MPDVYTARKTGEPEPPIPTVPLPVREEAIGKVLEPLSEERSPDYWRKITDRVLREAGESPRRVVYGAYHVRPRERFIMQQQDEEIVLLLRAHPITNAGWMVMVLVMLIIPSLLSVIGIFGGVDWRFVFMGKMAWYLVITAVAFEKFLYWYYTLFLVTNERLVDIDFNNLLQRVMTYANLNHIEEPTMMTGGFIRSMFQYGDVVVTTASEQPTIEALGVPWPQKVVDIISRLAEELEKRRAKGE